MNTVWLDKCFKAAEMLYGVFPFGVLERLYGGKLDRDETIKAAEGKFDYIDSNLDEFEALGYAPGYFTPTIYEDGEEYEKYKARGDKLHISEREVEYLLEKQENRPFYIPTHNEVEELFEKGMLENESYKKLKKKIPNVRAIWESVYRQDEINEIIEKAIAQCATESKDGMPVVDMDELNEMAALIIDCFNHTNLITNRGWEPMKLREALGERMPKTVAPQSSEFAKLMKEAEPELKKMGFDVDYESGFGEFSKVENGKVKKIKVGRNDPCPCGSGKKYKKCHGREKVKSTQGKTKDTVVVFAPEELSENYNQVYWVYGSEEGLLYTKRKQAGIDSKSVKCKIMRQSGEPNMAIIYDSFMHENASKLPGVILEDDGVFAFLGRLEDNGELVVFVG